MCDLHPRWHSRTHPDLHAEPLDLIASDHTLTPVSDAEVRHFQCERFLSSLKLVLLLKHYFLLFWELQKDWSVCLN